MNKIIYHIIPSLLILLVTGCEKKEKYEFDPDFFPRIFDQTGVFTSPMQVISEGETVEYAGLVFSPAGKVDVTWKVDGQEVSKAESYAFSPSSGGEFEITLEVTNNGQTAVRRSKVLVSPSEYTFDSYTKVAMSYLSESGSVANIDWNTVNHIAFKAARALPDGQLDVMAGETNQVANELVARAHINKKRVLLGVSGRLSGLDGWALYDGNDFGSAIVDPARRALFVENLINYMTAKQMDGIDIMMNDINLSSGHAPNLQALGPLLTELRTALDEDKLLTLTVGVGWQHWDYPVDLSMVDWVNVRAFENGLTVGPGAPLGQPSPYQFMVDGADIWLNSHGIPADKIVIGIPAFGLRYDELDGDGNNLGWGSYGYMSYSEILAADATASEKEHIPTIGKGVFYNGIPLVRTKAAYIRDNNFKGGYLWAGDYDVLGEKSLMKALYDTLHE